MKKQELVYLIKYFALLIMGALLLGVGITFIWANVIGL